MEQATQEANLVLCMGDFNLDADKLGDNTYYLKSVAAEYNKMRAQNALQMISYGVTYCRIHKDGKVVRSALDHTLTNKIQMVQKPFKKITGYTNDRDG